VNLELSRSGNGVRNGFRRPDGRGSGQFAESALDTLYVARNRGIARVPSSHSPSRARIGSFILASDRDRPRPSDLTTGVRKLRGEPQTKIAEWASRFSAMGWLRPENNNTPIPSAWLVVRGLREHFAERREQAQIARAQAHAILNGGGPPMIRVAFDKFAGMRALATCVRQCLTIIKKNFCRRLTQPRRSRND
jgi:hypothetical protein